MRQLFERKSSEPSKQASLPSVNTKKAVKAGSQSGTPKAIVKMEDNASGAADLSPKLSPFQVHNIGADDTSGQLCLSP